MKDMLLVLTFASVAGILQSQQPPERGPTDAMAALLASPVRPPDAAGQRVRVVDAANRPVAGAEVYVADWNSLGAPLRDYARATFLADAPIWLAARTGARYQADGDGVARVACPPGATIGAIHLANGARGLRLLGDRIVVRGTRVDVPVEVLDAHGRPAAGVPVVIGHVHPQDFARLAGGVTDRRGRTTLRYELSANPGERRAEVHVPCVDHPPARVAVTADWLANPGRLLQVQLPPAGLLRIRLRDEAGASVDDSRITVRGAVHGEATVPLVQDAEGCLFGPIAVGGIVLVEIRHAGALGAPQRLELTGPSAPGETAEHEVRVEHLPPAQPDPRVIAALRAAGGAAGPGNGVGEMRIRIGNGGRAGEGRVATGTISLELPEPLRHVEGLFCELERRGEDGAPAAVSRHPVPHREARSGAMPSTPVLLGRIAASDGARVVPGIAPGEYTLRLRLGEHEVFRATDVVVQPGRDTPLERLDPQFGAVPVAAVQLLDERGSNLPGSVVLLAANGAPPHPRVASTPLGRVDVPCVPGLRLFAQSPEHRSVEVLPAATAAEPHAVRLVPRARVRLRLPDGLCLPDGVVVVFPGEHPALDVRWGWRNDADNIVRPDASSRVTARLLVETAFGLQPLGCECDVELPTGGEEHVVELPIDQTHVDAAARHALTLRMRHTPR